MNHDPLSNLFREMRDEPVPADSLARVRLGVEGRIKRRRHSAWLIPSLAAAVLMAAALLITTLLRPVPPLPAPPTLIASVPAAPAMAAPPKARRYIHHPHPPLLAQAGTTVRIETSDPNVVILLVE